MFDPPVERQPVDPTAAPELASTDPSSVKQKRTAKPATPIDPNSPK